MEPELKRLRIVSSSSGRAAHHQDPSPSSDREPACFSDKTFWQDVDNLTYNLRRDPNIVLSCFDDAPILVEDNLQASAAFIRTHVLPFFQFKVGITENPQRRWAQHSANGWARMALLYCGPTGKAKWKESSGRLETELIRIFSDYS